MTGEPQLEDGHTRIANELLDAITSFDLSKRHLKILLAVMRNTYGWNRKMAPCSLSWLAGKTGMDESACSKGVAKLTRSGLLKRQPGYSQVLGINKHYNEWRGCQNDNPDGCQNSKGLSKRQVKGCQNDILGVVKIATIKASKQKQGIKTLSKPEKHPFGNAFFKTAYAIFKAHTKVAPSWDHTLVASVFESLKDHPDLTAEWVGYMAYSNKYKPQLSKRDPLRFKEWLVEVYSFPKELEDFPEVQAAVTAYMVKHQPPPYHTPEEVKEYMDRNPDLHWDNDMEFNGFWRYWVAKMKHYGHIKSTAPDGHGQYVGATPVMQARWDLATEWWENKVGKLGDTL